jgi:hypothetical protein
LQESCWEQNGWSSKFCGKGGWFPRCLRSVAMDSLAVAMIL